MRTNVRSQKASWSIYFVAVTTILLAGAAIAQDGAGARPQNFKGRPYSPYADRAFPTQVYFGDTHVHTALSADAGGGGTRLMPRDAYRFARGEQVISNTGQPVKLQTPFDFYMITDHSDAMGAIVDILKGTPNILADPVAKKFHEAFKKGEAMRHKRQSCIQDNLGRPHCGCR
jgi:hypothetical protein